MHIPGVMHTLAVHGDQLPLDQRKCYSRNWRENCLLPAVDCTQVLRERAEVHFPAAAKIVRVCDNLYTRPSYKAFDQATADRLAARFKWHYTPPHGSWLNMAEIELSQLSRPCLRCRMTTEKFVTDDVAAWCPGPEHGPDTDPLALHHRRRPH